MIQFSSEIIEMCLSCLNQFYDYRRGDNADRTHMIHQSATQCKCKMTIFFTESIKSFVSRRVLSLVSFCPTNISFYFFSSVSNSRSLLFKTIMTFVQVDCYGSTVHAMRFENFKAMTCIFLCFSTFT